MHGSPPGLPFAFTPGPAAPCHSCHARPFLPAGVRHEIHPLYPLRLPRRPARFCRGFRTRRPGPRLRPSQSAVSHPRIHRATPRRRQPHRRPPECPQSEHPFRANRRAGTDQSALLRHPRRRRRAHRGPLAPHPQNLGRPKKSIPSVTSPTACPNLVFAWAAKCSAPAGSSGRPTSPLPKRSGPPAGLPSTRKRPPCTSPAKMAPT